MRTGHNALAGTRGRGRGRAGPREGAGVMRGGGGGRGAAAALPWKLWPGKKVRAGEGLRCCIRCQKPLDKCKLKKGPRQGAGGLRVSLRRVHTAVCRVLGAIRCALCAVCCALCAVCIRRCAGCWVPCASGRVPGAVRHVPRGSGPRLQERGAGMRAGVPRPGRWGWRRSSPLPVHA